MSDAEISSPDSTDHGEPPPARPPLETLLARALRLRCPRCGEGKLFVGWFKMPPRCPHCLLKLEPAPGYYLGAAYINYGMTALVTTVSFVTLRFGLGWSREQAAIPLAAFCIGFPLLAFRHARALWLALDCHFDASMLAGDE